MTTRSHDDTMAEIFAEDPVYALDLLFEILKDGDAAEMSIVLRQMGKAFGDQSPFEAVGSQSAEEFFVTLSNGGNPDLHALATALKPLGLRLTIQPEKAA